MTDLQAAALVLRLAVDVIGAYSIAVTDGAVRSLEFTAKPSGIRYLMEAAPGETARALAVRSVRLVRSDHAEGLGAWPAWRDRVAACPQCGGALTVAPEAGAPAVDTGDVRAAAVRITCAACRVEVLRSGA